MRAASTTLYSHSDGFLHGQTVKEKENHFGRSCTCTIVWDTNENRIDHKCKYSLNKRLTLDSSKTQRSASEIRPEIVVCSLATTTSLKKTTTTFCHIYGLSSTESHTQCWSTAKIHTKLLDCHLAQINPFCNKEQKSSSQPCSHFTI